MDAEMGLETTERTSFLLLLWVDCESFDVNNKKKGC